MCWNCCRSAGVGAGRRSTADRGVGLRRGVRERGVGDRGVYERDLGLEEDGRRRGVEDSRRWWRRCLLDERRLLRECRVRRLLRDRDCFLSDVVCCCCCCCWIVVMDADVGSA